MNSLDPLVQEFLIRVTALEESQKSQSKTLAEHTHVLSSQSSELLSQSEALQKIEKNSETMLDLIMTAKSFWKLLEVIAKVLKVLGPIIIAIGVFIAWAKLYTLDLISSFKGLFK